jgi:arsenite methyltransferase
MGRVFRRWKKNYLRYRFDFEDDNFASVYDELPLWSAPFGLTLLEVIKMKKGMKVLDFGCGTGFPGFEIAQRLGETSHVYGLDPWSSALRRIRLKRDIGEVNGISIIRGVAEEMPFKSKSFDLIVANNGINNVRDTDVVLRECSRVGGQMVLTVNLLETMKRFYSIFEETLRTQGKVHEIESMRNHIRQRRMKLSDLQGKIRCSGFRIKRTIEDSFEMRFSDGTAILNHFFIKSFFMEGWREVLKPEEEKGFFSSLEEGLNRWAEEEGEVRLRIPFACLDCVKEKNI